MAEFWGKNAPNETTRLLAASVAVSKENELIAQRTIEELAEQGEILEETRDKVGSIHDISVLSRASVRTLEAKVFRRKILLYVCIGVLSIINMLLLIRMFNNGGSLYGHK